LTGPEWYSGQTFLTLTLAQKAQKQREEINVIARTDKDEAIWGR
jgi:hypothetical protein